MGSNSFGTIFRITTWGESHGPALGVVIDGCPAGLELSEQDLLPDLQRRAPGINPYTSPRKEKDNPQILSGIFEGKTTGAPISIIIYNHDSNSTPYISNQHLLKPGHANFTYLQKYGVFDHRGSGRASARETVCRVAAGCVAKKLLSLYDIKIEAYLVQVGSVSKDQATDFTKEMTEELHRIQQEGDSVGGVIEFIASGLSPGIGDPIYEKLEANLAKALLSIPATKGFEIGTGFKAASMHGSEHNDLYEKNGSNILTQTNHAGGTLAGISTGMPLIGRVAFKPTSSIRKTQSTLTLDGKEASFSLPEGSRHDPCVALRAVPVVEAMVALVLADALLMNRCARL